MSDWDSFGSELRGLSARVSVLQRTPEAEQEVRDLILNAHRRVEQAEAEITVLRDLVKNFGFRINNERFADSGELVNARK